MQTQRDITITDSNKGNFKHRQRYRLPRNEDNFKQDIKRQGQYQTQTNICRKNQTKPKKDKIKYRYRDKDKFKHIKMMTIKYRYKD